MGEKDMAFGLTADRGDGLSDTDFLQRVRWRKSADRELVAAATAGSPDTFCEVLRSSLSPTRGSRSKVPSGVLPMLLQPLWSRYAWDDPATTDRLSELLLELQRRQHKRSRKTTRKVSQLVRDAREATSIDESGWALVVWQTILLSTSDLLDNDTLLSLWRATLATTMQLVAVEEHAADQPDFVDDRQLLLCGELPCLSGITFSAVKGSQKLLQQGSRELRSQLEALTDTDGTPHARALHRLPLTLAVFTRSLALTREFEEKLFDKASAERFRHLVARAALMTQASGRLALSNGSSFATGSLLKSASLLADVTNRHAAGRRVESLPDDTPSSSASFRARQESLPKPRSIRPTRVRNLPSTQSDWAALTCMRNNWLDGGDSCIIAHHDAVPQLSVTGFERLLIDGAWRLDVKVDGKPVAVGADWECVCWFSDKDADYVELQQETAGGVTLMRQALLSRTDHWLWLADNARLSTEADSNGRTLHLKAGIPLAGTPQTKDNRWTREIVLQSEGLKWRAYPLGLTEERVHKADGSLALEGEHLVLQQTTTGPGLHMPLLLDWSPARRRDASQWRQLTIAEDGRRLPAPIACGQRLRIGKHQWLFYHSHEPGATARSVLGHHTPHETVVAEFTAEGEVEPIVLVE